MKLETFNKLVAMHVDARATDEVVAACRDHLVEGVKIPVASSKHGVQVQGVRRLCGRLKGLLADAAEVYECENS